MSEKNKNLDGSADDKDLKDKDVLDGNDPDDSSDDDEGGEGKDPKDAKDAKDGEDGKEWDDKTKDYVKKLRKESASYRTKAKQLEEKFDKLVKAVKGDDSDDSADPVEKAKQIAAEQARVQDLEFKNQVAELAIENGLGAKEHKYLKFLISEAASQLDEGEELSEDMLEGLIKEAKGVSGPKSGGSTSVDANKNGGDKKNPDNKGEAVSLEEFVKMTFIEKGQLFGKNPDLYKKLTSQAMDRRLI